MGAAPHHMPEVKSRVKERLRRGETTRQICSTMNVNESFVKRMRAQIKQEESQKSDDK